MIGKLNRSGFAGGSNLGGAMSKQTSNKFSPEVRSRAVRLVLDHEHDHPSRWATIVPVRADPSSNAMILTMLPAALKIVC